MTAQLADMTLRLVNPSRLLFQQRHPALPDTKTPPDWYTKAGKGGVGFAPWIRGSVLAVMETKAERPAYFAVVAVVGLYMTDEQAAVRDSERKAIDDSPLQESTQEQLAEFAQRVMDDLHPFIRQELYNLSGSIQGVAGIMLQPNPRLQRDSLQRRSSLSE
jgi:hypothetical protein